MRTAVRFVCLSLAGVLLGIPFADAEIKPYLLQQRYGHYAFPLGSSQVLILGGFVPGPSSTTAVEMYDYRSGKGKVLSPVPFVVGAAIQLTDDSLLVCEYDSLSAGQIPRRCAVYGMANDLWQPIDMPKEIGFNHFLVKLPHGSALIGGGWIRTTDGPYTSATITKSAYVLDPNSFQWRRVSDTINGWYRSAGVLLTDGRAFFAGGINTEIFDPTSGQWATAASADVVIRHGDQDRVSDPQLPLPGNKVLVLSESPHDKSQIYDASRNQWSGVPGLPSGIIGATMNVLPNGQVLIAGGYQVQIDIQVVGSATWLYDPRTGAVRQGASMTLPRSRHAGVVLPDGQVLLMGGIVQHYSDTAWINWYFCPGVHCPDVARFTEGVESFPWEPVFNGTLDPGYYIVATAQTRTGKGGFWGIELRSSGTLAGGLNFGGSLGDGINSDVGFGAFYLSTAQTVSTVIDIPGGSDASQGHFSMRIMDASGKTVAGPVQGGAHFELQQALQPGFYVLSIQSDVNWGSYLVSISAPKLDGGGSSGSLISRRMHDEPGFIAFYLDTRQEIAITLYNQNTYGVPRGAGEVILTLQQQLQGDSRKTLYQSGPGVLIGN
jgi:hypothetical protein